MKKFKKNKSQSTKEDIKKIKKAGFDFSYIRISFYIIFILFVGTISVFFFSTALNQENLLSPNIGKNRVEVLAEEKKLVSKLIDQKYTPPVLEAASVLAIDFEAGDILYQKNAHHRLPPASTTKIMTALVANEFFKPDDVLTVFPKAVVGGSTMGLIAFEKISYRDLLYGMMLNSGNDASYTIALNYPGSMDNFMNKMNEKVSELGLVNTHFENPAGFDHPNHYSSAGDLAIIAKVAAQNPELSKIFSTKETVVSSSLKAHKLKNLNKLLGEQGVLGIKTGFTEKSGENLVGLVEKDNHKVLTVILNSEDRFDETKKLIDWIYQNYKWVEVYE